MEDLEEGGPRDAQPELFRMVGLEKRVLIYRIVRT